MRAPAAGLRIPAGQAGQTIVVRVSAGPTYFRSVVQKFFYVWVGSAPPSVGAPPPSTGNAPPGPSKRGAAPPAPGSSPPAVRGPGPAPRSAWSPPPGRSGAEPLTSPPDPVIVKNGADGGVTAGAIRPATFELSAPYLVSQIMTYHYGSGATPGTIALRAEDGTVYGPWRAAGAGSPALPNIYWWVRPDVVLPPGRYTVIDSDPATWSREAATAGAGIFVIWGRRP